MLMVGGGTKDTGHVRSVCENFWTTPTFCLNYAHFCVKRSQVWDLGQADKSSLTVAMKKRKVS